MTDIELERVSRGELTLEKVVALETVAQTAWTHDLRKTRSPAEIATRFNTTMDHIDEVMPRYQGFSNHGSLVMAKHAGDVIGFAMARNDVTPFGRNVTAVAERTIKRIKAVIRPQESHVYPWINHIVVDPEFQRQKVGARLVAATLDGQFNLLWKPTGYVFDEGGGYHLNIDQDEVAIGPEPFSTDPNPAYQFAQAMGFDVRPYPQQAAVKPNYFGPETRPVIQYRLEGQSVGAVLEAAYQLIAA